MNPVAMIKRMRSETNDELITFFIRTDIQNYLIKRQSEKLPTSLIDKALLIWGPCDYKKKNKPGLAKNISGVH